MNAMIFHDFPMILLIYPYLNIVKHIWPYFNHVYFMLLFSHIFPYQWVLFRMKKNPPNPLISGRWCSVASRYRSPLLLQARVSLEAGRNYRGLSQIKSDFLGQNWRPWEVSGNIQGLFFFLILKAAFQWEWSQDWSTKSRGFFQGMWMR